MAWIRLYALVEGHAERKFAEIVLHPHLLQFEIELRAILTTTSRKKSGRGGMANYAQIKNDLQRRMRQDRSHQAHFTTMLDLYGLPNDFPGWAKAQRQSTPQECVAIIEKAMQNDLADRRFTPYIQLHEFEALLYCDLTQLSQRISGSEQALRTLAEEVKGIPPEDINQGHTTAPSKRITQHVPIYERSKVRAGAPAAAAIGLHTLRTNCPHFNAWVTQLEKLNTTS